LTKRLYDEARRRPVRIADAEVDDVGPGGDLRPLLAVNLREEVGGQGAEAIRANFAIGHRGHAPKIATTTAGDRSVWESALDELVPGFFIMLARRCRRF